MGVLAKEEEYIPRYTYEEYKRWEGKWEIINGIAYAMSPAPIIRHQEVSYKIARELEEKAKDCAKCKSLQAVDWKMDDSTVVCPDNLLVCGDEIGEAYLTKAPEIIFEILSPSTAFKDRNVKSKLYARSGVKYYILVDTNAGAAEIFLCEGEEYHKLCNVQNDTFTFSLKECEVVFDFEKIWR